jgi:Ca2+-binding RTX toxin-like protein
MSYRSYVDAPLTGLTQRSYPTTPMLNDIAAIQYLYGANMTTRSGDTVYSWASGQLLSETIWDAGGIDTIDWSNQYTPAKINLNAGQWSQLGPEYWNGIAWESNTVAIAYNVTIENARGGSGNDTLEGNSIDNLLQGGAGDDSLNGGAGNDTLEGGSGNDQLFGGDGNDVLDGGAGVDTLSGGAGNDTYYIDNPLDIVIEEENGGRVDKVSINVTNGSEDVNYTLAANVEILQILGGGVNKVNINATGNELNNFLIGNYYQNFLFGLDGNDTLEGLGGSDFLYGGAGNDIYRISDATDTITEDVDAGIDTVESKISLTLGANLENLTLYKNPQFPGSPPPQDDPLNGIGNELDNSITGNNANNILSGKQGNDTLLGEGGDDRIVGGIGEDILTGGDGADRFYRWRSGTGVDTITDFQVGEDLLYFSAKGFGGDLVKGGVLGQEQFTLGTSATNESNRFIYDTDTGNLFFDIDGTGDIAQVQIATLSSGLALSNTDIFIF